MVDIAFGITFVYLLSDHPLCICFRIILCVSAFGTAFVYQIIFTN